MRFDPKSRTFSHRGIALDSAEARRRINAEISNQQNEVSAQVRRVLAGSLALSAFFDWMRVKVHHWHGVIGSIAYGGESQMSTARWLALNRVIKKQFDYLDKWQAAAEQGERVAELAAIKIGRIKGVPDGLEDLVEREVLAVLKRGQ